MLSRFSWSSRLFFDQNSFLYHQREEEWNVCFKSRREDEEDLYIHDHTSWMENEMEGGILSSSHSQRRLWEHFENRNNIGEKNIAGQGMQLLQDKASLARQVS